RNENSGRRGTPGFQKFPCDAERKIINTITHVPKTSYTNERGDFSKSLALGGRMDCLARARFTQPRTRTAVPTGKRQDCQPTLQNPCAPLCHPCQPTLPPPCAPLWQPWTTGSVADLSRIREAPKVTSRKRQQGGDRPCL